MKKFSLAMVLFFTLALSLVLPTSAANINLLDATDIVESENAVETRSIDTTFDLDFSSSSGWTIDFDNEGGWFHFNHTNVDVFYESYVNADFAPTVTIKLQKLENGIYNTVETKYCSVGRTVSFAFPDGGTLTDYRLHFSASSKATCTFSVESYR